MEEKTEGPRKVGYSHERISAYFGTHKLPEDLYQRFVKIKGLFEELAHQVLDLTPPSPHQTIAINKIIEAKDAAALGMIVVEMTKVPASDTLEGQEAGDVEGGEGSAEPSEVSGD